MKITFETEISQDFKTELSVTQTTSGVFIDVAYLNKDFKEREETHFLSKEGLKDFIGSLLYVQSKLNKQ